MLIAMLKVQKLGAQTRPYVGEGIVRIWRGEQQLQRQTQCSHLQRGRPLVLENVEADATETVDVGTDGTQGGKTNTHVHSSAKEIETEAEIFVDG
jgi:hypothetical protein